MINPNHERKYIPGNPICRGCMHCPTTSGKILWTIIFIACVGLGGFRLMMRYDEFNNAQAILVQSYNLDGLKDSSAAGSMSGSAGSSSQNSNLPGKSFPNITICNYNPIIVNHTEEANKIYKITEQNYKELLYFDDTFSPKDDNPLIEPRYLHILNKIYEAAMTVTENSDNLIKFFDTILENSDSISTWANVLRNVIIPATHPLFLVSPNNITQYLKDNPNVIDSQKVAEEAFSVIDKHTTLDIQFRNSTFTNLLYNSINLGGIYTNEYKGGLESILPDEMMAKIKENYQNDYDKFLTSLQVSRAPYAFSHLNRNLKTSASRQSDTVSVYKNLQFFDRKNSSFETMDLKSKEFTVEKIVKDFSWVERDSNGTILNLRTVNLGLDSLGLNLEQDDEPIKVDSYITRMGECLKVTTNKEIIRQTLNGPQNGLKFLVNTGNLQNEPWHDFTGLAIILHREDDFYPLYDDNFHFTNLKSTVSINLKENEIKRLTEPKGTCNGDDTTTNINQCLEACEIKKLSEACGCRIPFDTLNENDFSLENDNCTWYELRSCDISTDNLKVDYEECGCKIPCHEKVLISESTVQEHDEIGFLSANVGKSIMASELGENDVEVLVYFSDLQSLQLEEKEADDFMTFLFDAIIIIACFTGFTVAACCEGIVCLVFNCCCKKHHLNEKDYQRMFKVDIDLACAHMRMLY